MNFSVQNVSYCSSRVNRQGNYINFQGGSIEEVNKLLVAAKGLSNEKFAEKVSFINNSINKNLSSNELKLKFKDIKNSFEAAVEQWNRAFKKLNMIKNGRAHDKYERENTSRFIYGKNHYYDAQKAEYQYEQRAKLEKNQAEELIDYLADLINKTKNQ